MFHDIVDACFVAINVCQHLTWFLLKPETKDFVEISTKGWIQLVLFRNLNECKESVQNLVVLIFKKHFGYVLDIDAKSLGGNEWKLETSWRRVIELRLLNNKIDNLDELMFIQVLQQEFVTLSQLRNEIIIIHYFKYS